MNSGSDSQWSQWFSKKQTPVSNNKRQQEEMIMQCNPTLIKMSPKQSTREVTHNKENMSLEAYAKAFVRDVKKTQEQNASRISESINIDNKKKNQEESSKNSIWSQFLSTKPITSSHNQQSTSTASFNRILDTKSAYFQPIDTTSTPSPKKRKLEDYCQGVTPEITTSNQSTMSNDNAYYQRQSNNLEGGVYIMGKAPTKTERKQVEKKRLKEEKKLLMKEMRGKSHHEGTTHKSKEEKKEKKEKKVEAEKNQSTIQQILCQQKTVEAEKSQSTIQQILCQQKTVEAEKSQSTIQQILHQKKKERLSESSESSCSQQKKESDWNEGSGSISNPPKKVEGVKKRGRPKKEKVFPIYSFDSFLAPSLPSSIPIIHSIQDISFLTSPSSSYSIIFFSYYNNSFTSFENIQTTHDDLLNHTLPIALVFSVFQKTDSLSSLVYQFIIKLHGHCSSPQQADLQLIQQEYTLLHTLFSFTQHQFISWSIQRQLRLLHFYFHQYLHKDFLQSALMKTSFQDLEILYWLADSDYHDSQNYSFTDICSLLHHPSFDFSQLLTNMKDQLNQLLSLCLAVLKEIQAILQPTEIQAYQAVERPLLVLLALLDCTGIAVQRDYLMNMKPRIVQQLKAIENEVTKLIGHPVCLSSPKQVSAVLYDELNLQIEGMKTHSTAEKILKLLAPQHPLPNLVIQHRKISKLLGSYIDGMIKECLPDQLLNEPFYSESQPGLSSSSYSIFTTWNQKSTGTGRLSSTCPNLQSLPKKSLNEIDLEKEIIQIRPAFTSHHDTSTILISVDYKQIEMRLFAHLSNDANFIQLLNNPENNDIYRLMASYIHTETPLDQITTQQREQAKVITLGLCYGMGVESMASQLGIQVTEATAIKKKILTKFPGIQVFMNDAVQMGREKHYVETLAGRRRRLKNATSKEEESKVDRQSINSIVQGSAADLLKVGMILLWEKLEKLDCRLVLQIHDELVIECPNEEKRIEEAKRCLTQVLSMDAKEFLQNLYNQNHPDHIQQFIVPLEQSIQVGKNLGFC